MASDSSSAFESFHPSVQQWIWAQGWTELRDIQELAAKEILSGPVDVVIASATASGKTEAAFLPIGSTVVEEGRHALVTLYVSPLKALINDQHRRLEDFFGALDIQVHRWHGDVGASVKQKLVKNPSGVLLITPESLEALFVRRGSVVPGLFVGLRHVVVDELHAFIGSERGRQLQSLMHRVELAAHRRVPRIALSATLGDMDIACDFLRPGEGPEVRRVVSDANRQDVRLQIRGYQRVPPVAQPKSSGGDEGDEAEVDVGQVAAGDEIQISLDLYAQLRGGRHIVFTNTRHNVELYTDLLRRLSDRDRVPNEFWPHHGSLDKAFREEAEDALRAASRPATVMATTTLELGIDVGSVESIGQIGPPPSVASMRQRLGRSGRRGSPAVLRIYVQEDEIDPRTAPHDQLRPSLVQSVAMVRLLALRWYEPPTAGALHLSTLVQQSLSLLAQHGGAKAEQMWSALCRTGPFSGVDTTMFESFLRDLASHDLVQQTLDGEIVLGLSGERLVNHYDFYSAFFSPDEHRLVSGSRTLGTLPVTSPLTVDMYIIFGGRRWRVLSVDAETRTVDLSPAGGGRVPSFAGSRAPVHDGVRREMRLVLAGEDTPRFVDEVGLGLLREGRAAYSRFGLAERSMLSWGRTTLLFPWAGTRATNTILLQLLARGLKATDEGLAISVEAVTPDETAVHVRALVDAGPADAKSLALKVENKIQEKHHQFLGEDLLSADYASSQLDTVAAHRALAAIAVGV